MDQVREGPGAVIGRYKLLEQIGEGGFGVVFLAEQREPVQRRVALKVIKLGMDTRQVIARFEAERQALALMDHPNIATVLDAGATGAGRPYFVMELVKNSMGLCLNAQERPAEAEPYFREALEKGRRVLGEDHPSTLTAIVNLGTLLRKLGRLDEAEPLRREALEKSRRMLEIGRAHV